MRRTVSGPRTAEEFAAWVLPSLPAMTRLAARLSPPGERDDVVQEALVRAWSKRSQFDSTRGAASSWLLAITADQARKAHRRAHPLALVDSKTPVRLLDDRVDHLDIEFAVARLPTRQRLAVDCYYFVGLSVGETAAVMGCAEGTVKSTLADARARLQRLLEVDHG